MGDVFVFHSVCFHSMPTMPIELVDDFESEMLCFKVLNVGEDEEVNLVNSNANRALYMQFYRKMGTKKMARLSPDIATSFKERGNRATLFVDYYKSMGDTATMTLKHRRRLHQKTRASRVLRPKTKQQLMEANRQDEDYVSLIIAECVRLNRWSRDKYKPQTVELNKYWVLDDESLTLEAELDIETSLEADDMDVSSDAALGMTTGGGMFSDTASIGTDGVSALQAGDLMNGLMSQPDVTLAMQHTRSGGAHDLGPGPGGASEGAAGKGLTGKGSLLAHRQCFV